MKISELKKEARVKLTGKWPLVIGINFIHLIISLVLAYTAEKAQNLISPILLLVSVILTIPLSYGLTASMLKISRDEEVGLTDFITIGFKNFKRALFLSLSIFIRVLIPVILSIIILSISIMSFNNSTNILAIVFLVLMIVLFTWMLYIVLSLALSTYILIDNENASSKDAIKTSIKLMKGNKLNFICLVLSFVGWIFLTGIVSGVIQVFNVILGTLTSLALSLLLTPYITFTEIGFYEDLANVSKDFVKSEPEVEKITSEETSSEQ